MDYFMPTLSFKDRGAAVLVAHCKAIGVERYIELYQNAYDAYLAK